MFLVSFRQGFKSCYPKLLESLGDVSPRLFFLGKRLMKASIYMGKRNVGRTDMRGFGKDVMTRFGLKFCGFIVACGLGGVLVTVEFCFCI